MQEIYEMIWIYGGKRKGFGGGVGTSLLFGNDVNNTNGIDTTH